MGVRGRTLWCCELAGLGVLGWRGREEAGGAVAGTNEGGGWCDDDEGDGE